MRLLLRYCVILGAPLHRDTDKVENRDNDSSLNATDDHRSRASVEIAPFGCRTTDHERVLGCSVLAGSRIVSLDDMVNGLLGEMNGSQNSTDCIDEEKDSVGLED